MDVANEATSKPPLVGFNPPTHLVGFNPPTLPLTIFLFFYVRSSTDWEEDRDRVTTTPSIICSTTSPSGVMSLKFPASETVSVGICHIQIDHASPTSCTSTCVDVKTVYVGSLTGKAIHNKTQILADIAFNGVQVRKKEA